MSDLDEKLRALPVKRNEHDPAPAAREAFEKAFGRTTVRTELIVQADGSIAGRGVLARSIVPVFLAGVIALYLLWAFSAAIALQG